MWPFHVQCLDCESLISRLAAKRMGGRCSDCEVARAQRDAELQAQLDAQRREHARRLLTGEIYRPSSAEIESATMPFEFQSVDCRWNLQPEFYREYREGTIKTLNESIQDAESQERGVLFLVSNLNGQLNVGLSDKYGVCEYVNEETGQWLYAYTERNLREQVDEQHQVVQSCPCCGVELLWYPSRFHLPRRDALELALRASRNESPNGVSWLDSGDFSWTEKGRG